MSTHTDAHTMPPTTGKTHARLTSADVDARRHKVIEQTQGAKKKKKRSTRRVQFSMNRRRALTHKAGCKYAAHDCLRGMNDIANDFLKKVLYRCVHLTASRKQSTISGADAQLALSREGIYLCV